MKYKVILAEKPSVALSIANIVGAKTSHKEGSNGYLEGNGYRVTWAFGHLIGLKSPKDMNLESFPYFPTVWETKIPESVNKQGKKEIDKAKVKQVKLIGSLFKEAEYIIVATDAGREGELIFRYIYEYLKCKTPFYRLWISSLTDEAIKKGLNEIKDGKEYDRLSDSAHARSQADWLVGMNASTVLKKISQYKGILSLGRVQSPTLNMIVQRYLDNISFTPKPYWNINVFTNKNNEKENIKFKVVSEDKYFDENKVDNDITITQNYGKLQVVKVEYKKCSTKPPLLYDLTSLQRSANSRYGFSADETLKIAQKLYEEKFISYPRTGSRYIPKDVFKTIYDLLKKLEVYDKFTINCKKLQKIKLCTKSVNDSKVTDHHALLPTGLIPINLNDRETKIYELILSRLLEAFNEDYTYTSATIICKADTVTYKATGTIPIYWGWKVILGKVTEENETDEEDEEDIIFPNIKEGEELPIDNIEKQQKFTKPQPIFTDSSLLGEMETCGKRIEDEEVREAMKEVGIGTPATRANIIETLILRKYIERQGKKLIPTELGTQIQQLIKNKKIADVSITGLWERDLNLIEQGKYDKKIFDEKIKQFVMEIIEDLTNSEVQIKEENNKTFTCPYCQTQMKYQKFTISCDVEQGGCGYKIPKEVAGKKLTEKDITLLSEGKKTSLIKGFTSKSGKKFNAFLIPKSETKKIEFEFETNNNNTTTPTVSNKNCPCCNKKLIDKDFSFSCECGFIIWKTTCGLNLSEKQIDDILLNKKPLIKGLKAKSGNLFNAHLVINTDTKKVEFQFEKKN